MRVVSINAGPLQPLAVQREVIKTGFYKGPCDGAVRVAQIGIEGDARVACATDLNRAVFFYQASYYDQWRSELGRELPYGTIGENVTFDGPDDKDFFLGDTDWKHCAAHHPTAIPVPQTNREDAGG
jgi:MOSC domain-containing protein YiiM